MARTLSCRSGFGITAVERNNSGNVVRSEIINVDSEFRVVKAMNVEMPDHAMPNPKAIAKRTSPSTGWAREKKRKGGRRRVFLIHRPAMLPTSPAKSPADITSASDGGSPTECVVAA